jgi:hypothetical protein
MAHVDQLLQIYLKQLPLWLRRLALGLHQFFPSFMAVCCDYREILDQKTPKIIRFYHGFIGFSGSTALESDEIGICLTQVGTTGCGFSVVLAS